MHRALVVSGIVAAAVACKDVVLTEPDTGGGAPATEYRGITIQPSSVTVRVGQTAQVSAWLLDRAGQPVAPPAGRTVEYRSSDAAVFTVDASGLVTGTGPGTGALRAALGAFVIGIPVTTLPGGPRLELVSGSAQSGPPGAPLPEPLRVRALSDAGQPAAGVTVNFAAAAGGGSVAPAAPVTDASGIAETRWTLGGALGAQSVTAQAAGFGNVLTFTATAVARPIVRVEVSPPALAFTDVGQTAPLAATAFDDANQPVAGATFTWTSANPAVATVSATGVVTSIGSGTTTIRATTGTVSGTAQVTVTVPQPTARLAFQPATLRATVVQDREVVAAVDVVEAGGGSESLLGTVSCDAPQYGSGQPAGWLAVQACGDSVRVLATATGLAPGTYTASLPVRATLAVNSPALLPVELTVTAASVPVIALNPASVALAAAPGGSATGTAQVTNGGSGSLTGLSAAVTYASGQPTGWLTATLDRADAPASLALAASAATLAAGTYDATVRVASSVSGVAAVDLPVRLEVAAACTPLALPTLAASNLAVQKGFLNLGVGPAREEFAAWLFDASGGTITGLSTSVQYDGGPATGWLVATVSNTSTTPSVPSLLQIVIDTRSLPASPAVYTARVLVSSANGGTIEVPVRILNNGPAGDGQVPTFTIGLDPYERFAAIAGETLVRTARRRVAYPAPGGSGYTASVEYPAGAATGWLTAVLSATSGIFADLDFSVRAQALPPGYHRATVVLNSAQAGSTPLRIPVSVEVTCGGGDDRALPNVRRGDENFVIGIVQGQSDASVNAPIDDRSTAGTYGQLTVTNFEPAFQPSLPLRGELVPLGSGQALRLRTVPAEAAIVPPGFYYVVVSVEPTGPNRRPEFVHGYLNVVPGGAPSVGLRPPGVGIVVNQGTVLPVGFEFPAVTVENVGTGTLSGLTAQVVAYDPGIYAGWIDGVRLDSDQAPTTLRVVLSPTATQLPRGIYRATVGVGSATQPNVIPSTLDVALDIRRFLQVAVSDQNFANVDTLAVTVEPGGSRTATVNVRYDGDPQFDDLVVTVEGGLIGLDVAIGDPGTTTPTSFPVTVTVAPDFPPGGPIQPFSIRVSCSSGDCDDALVVGVLTVGTTPPADWRFGFPQSGGTTGTIEELAGLTAGVFFSRDGNARGVLRIPVYAPGGLGGLRLDGATVQATALAGGPTDQWLVATPAAQVVGDTAGYVEVTVQPPARGLYRARLALTVPGDPVARTFEVAVNAGDDAGGTTFRSAHAGDEVTCATGAEANRLHCWGASGLLVGQRSSLALPGDPGRVRSPVPVFANRADGADLDAVTVVRAVRVNRGGGIASDFSDPAAPPLRDFGDTTFASARGFRPRIPPRTGHWATDNALTNGRWRSFDLGSEHACAIDDGGRAWCWGVNSDGQLGDGTLTGRDTPTLVATAELFDSISVGTFHTCAWRTDGPAWCWGVSSGGSLGTGDPNGTRRTTPTLVEGGFGWRQLDAGLSATCGVTVAGELRCWGSTPVQATQPALVPTVVPGSGGRSWVEVEVGQLHACALEGMSALWCWGSNSFGQLGRGTVSSSSADWTPQPVQGGLGFTPGQLTAGTSHTCASSSEATPRLYCWGNNQQGQVGAGPGSPNVVTVPTLVAGQLGAPAPRIEARTMAAARAAASRSGTVRVGPGTYRAPRRGTWLAPTGGAPQGRLFGPLQRAVQRPIRAMPSPPRGVRVWGLVAPRAGAPLDRWQVTPLAPGRRQPAAARPTRPAVAPRTGAPPRSAAPVPRAVPLRTPH